MDTAAGIDPANLQVFNLVSNRYLFISLGFGCFASINYTVISSLKTLYILFIAATLVTLTTMYAIPITKNTLFCSSLFISRIFHDIKEEG